MSELKYGKKSPAFIIVCFRKQKCFFFENIDSNIVNHDPKLSHWPHGSGRERSTGRSLNQLITWHAGQGDSGRRNDNKTLSESILLKKNTLSLSSQPVAESPGTQSFC